MAAMVLPFLLEQVGVLPQFYVFEGGSWLIRPQMLALPPASVWFLAIVNVVMVVLPCLFISKLRAELSQVQARQLVQAWHYRRLAGKAV